MTIALLLVAAPVASAATVSGVQTEEYLVVTFRAAPGERNELGMVPRRGDDVGRGNGLVWAGPGKDDLRVVGGSASFHGGPGEDVLLGGRFRDLLAGGPGPDLLVGGRRFDEINGGRGRDQLAGGFGPDVFFAGPGDDLIRATDPKGDRIECGPGRDVAYVSRRDRTIGCERRLGPAGLTVYASPPMSRLADLRLLLLLPLRGE